MQKNKFSAVKKLLVIGIMAGGLAACGTENTPAPEKLSNNIEHVASTTVISVTSLQTYPVVGSDEEVAGQLGRYQVIDDVYDDSENRILIPSGATISGTYTNDGKTCRVTWKSIYANDDQTANPVNAVSISQVTLPSNCNAAKGVKAGDRLTIKFTEEAK